MKRKYLIKSLNVAALVIGGLFICNNRLDAQCPTNETFSSITVNGNTSFTSNSTTFTVSTVSGGPFSSDYNPGTGWTGTAAGDCYFDNQFNSSFGGGASFTISCGSAFYLKSFWLFVSDGSITTLGSGNLTVVGKNGASTVFTETATATGTTAHPGWNTSFSTYNGFTLIDMSQFGGVNNSFQAITSVTITTPGSSNMDYVAIEPFVWGKTTDPIPGATTSAATSVTATGATLTATVTANSSTATTTNTFEYGTSSTLASGNTFVAGSPATLTTTSATSVTKSLTSLSPTTTYYFRVIASNCNDTTFGSILNFTTPALNTPPTFVSSSPQSLVICENAGATSLISLLHVNDPDVGQTETWSQFSAPTHGTLNFSGATASSGSTNITPGGTITYTPNTNYSGTDAFTVQVSDGTATANMVVNVTVNPLPAAITNNVPLQVNTNLPLGDVTGGGTWTSASTGVATVGTTTGIVNGVSAGTSLVSYTLTSTGCGVTATVTVNAASTLTWFSATGGGDASVLTNWWSTNSNTGYQPTTFSTTGTTWTVQSSMTSTAPLTFTGDVSIVSGGTLTPQASSTTTVGGNWANAGTFSHNSGTVVFNGANTANSSNTLSGTMTGSNAFNNLTFNSPSLTYSFGTVAADVAGNFLLSSGTLTSSSATLKVAGNFTQSGGNFTPNGGTVMMNGSSGTITAAGMTTTTTSCFNNLSFNASSATTYTVSSDLLLMGNFNNITSSGTVALGSHTLTIGGNWTNAGPSPTGANSVIMNGSSTVTMTGNR